MNSISASGKNFLLRYVDPSMIFLVKRGQQLVFVGYMFIIAETFVAIRLGLTQIKVEQIAFLSFFSISVSLFLILFLEFKKVLLLWHEYFVFAVDLIAYLVFFILWSYWLEDMRFLGLISSLIAIGICHSYASFGQSLSLSLLTLLSYGSLSYVAIVLNGQSGSFVRELFFAFCLIPAFILCAITSKAVDTHKRRLKKARQELERKNEALFELNETLKFEQALTEAEMELAHDIQCALLPSKSPDVRDWDIAFYSRPKSAVSGDFYDFYSSNGTLDGLALFDVSGHGVAPALVTILLKPLLFKNFNRFNDNPVKIFEQSNKEVLEDLEDVNIYITGVLLKIKGNEVEYLNAGHPDILYLKDNGKVETIIDEGNSFKGRPLGIGDVLDYSSFTFNVNNNEMLLLYTDGLIESRNSGGKQFGSENLTLSFSKCSGMSASDSLNFILEEFYSFLGNSQPIDDITVIIAKKL